MLRKTPNRRHRWLAPANSGLESSYESRPGYHPVEVHTQAGPTQVSLHNQAVEALVDRSRLRMWRICRKGHISARDISDLDRRNDREQLVAIAVCSGTYKPVSVEPVFKVLGVICSTCALQQASEVLQQ